MRTTLRLCVTSLFTLSLGLGVAHAQNEPVPAPVNQPNKDKGKPKPPHTQQTQAQQVVIGYIQKIDLKQQIVVVKPRPSQPIQAQQTQQKPPKGGKASDVGLFVFVVDDNTAIQTPEGKGVTPEPKPAPEPYQGGKDKPKPEPYQGGKDKPKPEPKPEPYQGGKDKPKPEPYQGGKDKPKPDQGNDIPPQPIQSQISKLKVDQLVRVVHQQQDGKYQAIQIQVIPAPTSPSND